MEALIEEFLKINSGDGSGDGDGYGYGYGYGYGSGYGYGYGSGYGYGYGYGYGLKSYNKQKVYYIDSVPTLINQIKNNYAKGFMINKDLTLTDCFIAKIGNYFAHGKTLKQAFNDANEKYQSNLSTEEKIELFLKEFNMTDKYPAKSFYEWHGKLTGSCSFGRDSFMKDHGITLDQKFTVSEFIKLTKGSYGGDVIKRLEEKIS